MCDRQQTGDIRERPTYKARPQEDSKEERDKLRIPEFKTLPNYTYIYIFMLS